MHLVSLLEEKLCQVGSVLPCDPRDERDHRVPVTSRSLRFEAFEQESFKGIASGNIIEGVIGGPYVSAFIGF